MLTLVEGTVYAIHAGWGCAVTSGRKVCSRPAAAERVSSWALTSSLGCAASGSAAAISQSRDLIFSRSPRDSLGLPWTSCWRGARRSGVSSWCPSLRGRRPPAPWRCAAGRGADGKLAELRRFLSLGGLQQAVFVAHAGERLEDGALHCQIVGRGVNLREELWVVVGPAPLVHVGDGFHLQVGIGAAASDLFEQRLRLGGVALRQHEQRIALHFGRGGALELTFQQRDGALGVALHEPVDGHQFELFIALRFRCNALPRGLPEFEFERLAVIQPAAADV